MIMEGCQGKKDIAIMEKICPRCGHEIEIFSVDVSMQCENCGYTIYNDTLNCVQWCAYARQCVGDERYEQLMAIAKSQRERKEAARLAEAQGAEVGAAGANAAGAAANNASIAPASA